MIYGSTYITHGTGWRSPCRRAWRPRWAKIAGTLQQMAERPTPFQVEVRKDGAADDR